MSMFDRLTGNEPVVQAVTMDLACAGNDQLSKLLLRCDLRFTFFRRSGDEALEARLVQKAAQDSFWMARRPLAIRKQGATPDHDLPLR